MTDPTRLEPKNGDFVAYLDALQEESLEELRRANQAAISNPLKVPDAGEGETNLRQLEAEMKRQAQTDRAQSPHQTKSSADIEAWDSLAHIQLVMALSKHFHITFTTQEITSWQTLADILSTLQAKLA